MGQEELDLSTIWVALGVARDCYAKAARPPTFGNEVMVEFYLGRVNEMQLVRDKVEDRMRMLTELEEYDYGL